MKIILLERIVGLGELGELVDVKAGYARNFLIPKGRASEATKANIERFEAQRAEFERRQAERLAESQNRAEALNGKVLTIFSKAGDEGKLFGSVGTQQIAEAAKQHGLTLERQEILMPNGTIRELGDYEIDLQLYGNIPARILVRVAVGE